MFCSVHYEMPKSKHLHKSMLLRGVTFATPALTPSEIEETKGKAARSGRSHGGVPLRGNGRGRNSFNYASSNQYRGSHNSQQARGPPPPQYQNPFPPPPPGWAPPQPGMAGFARGPPPPPPGYASYGRGQQSNYSQSPNNGYGGQQGYADSNYDDRRGGGDSYRGGGGYGQGPRGGDSYRGNYGGR